MTSRRGISRSKVQGEMLVTVLQAWDEDVQQSNENWFSGHGPSARQVVMLALYTGIAGSDLRVWAFLCLGAVSLVDII